MTVDIPTPNHESRDGTKIIWAAVHTTEGIMDAHDLGIWFQPSSRQASSHAGCDRVKTLTYVEESEAAWTLRNGNKRSLNIEICGWASWTRDTWLGAEFGRVVQAATKVRSWCLKYNIPMVHLSTADVKANKPGI